MKRLAEINARGLANGWHAQELERKAKAANRTMADVFAESIRNSAGFSVPATAIKVTSAFITYRFADGSEAKFINQKH